MYKLLLITLAFCISACGTDQQIDDQIAEQDVKIWGLFYASEQQADEIITDFAPTGPKPSIGYVSSFFVKKELGDYYTLTLKPSFGDSVVCAFVKHNDTLSGNGLNLQFKNIDGKTYMLATKTSSSSSCPNIEFDKIFVD